MYENKCAICGQSILGYWYEVGKKNVCQSCAAITTVYDLFQRDIIDIKPDIVDGEATLVTKENEELSDELRSDNSDDATNEQVEKFFSSQEPAFNN